MKLALQLVGVTTALCLSTARAQADEPKTAPKAKKEQKLESCQLGSTYNVHRLGKIYLAGQPSAADFSIAKKDGIKTVINLRMARELRFDEKAVLKELGLEYHHIPFAAPDSLKDEIFDKSLKILSDKEKQPALLHCASANRVGAIWLVHRVLTDKVDYDKALKEAKEVGLKFPPYETKAKAYIQKTLAKANKASSDRK